MKMIKHLSDMIEEELEGAEHYAKCALKDKDTNPGLAKTFYEISLQEMEHVTRLHTEVVKVIEAYRKEHGEPPESMLAVYDYVHEKQIEKANMVKMLQSQYKGA